MTTLRMNEKNLVRITDEIIGKVEKQILEPSYDIDKIIRTVEDKMGILRHDKEVFKVSTGMGLSQYIKRRIYTNIVNEIGREEFNRLDKGEFYGIKSFKNKCLKEFPFLADDFDLRKMQLPIDKEMIYLSIMKQAKTKNINPIVKEITEGRELVDIPKSSSKILIQDNDNIIVDLDKTYFQDEKIIFNIDSNIAIRELAKFFSGGCELISPIYVRTLWVSANSEGFIRGSGSLILSTSCRNDKIYRIELSDKKFIIFESDKIWINREYYRSQNNV